jgi:hypothetical protein
MKEFKSKYMYSIFYCKSLKLLIFITVLNLFFYLHKKVYKETMLIDNFSTILFYEYYIRNSKYEDIMDKFQIFINMHLINEFRFNIDYINDKY